MSIHIWFIKKINLTQTSYVRKPSLSHCLSYSLELQSLHWCFSVCVWQNNEQSKILVTSTLPPLLKLYFKGVQLMVWSLVKSYCLNFLPRVGDIQDCSFGSKWQYSCVPWGKLCVGVVHLCSWKLPLDANLIAY